MQKKRRTRLFLTRLLVFLILQGFAVKVSQAQGEDWHLEKLVLRGGKMYQGILLGETKRQLEFAEIIRPRGKPMRATIHTVAKEERSRYEPLEESARKQLLERFNSLRNRATIEAGKMEGVRLQTVQTDGFDRLRYEGPWFIMLSSADGETTRRAIVRIEQMFVAYRQMLPPREARPASFTIQLFGSSAEYRSVLSRNNETFSEVTVELVTQHPAIYLPDRNTIIAGTDLDRFALMLAQAQQENERTRQQLRSLKGSHEQSLLEIASEMKRSSFSSAEIELEVRSRRAAWKEQQVKLEEAVDQAARRNSAQFAEVSRNMFRRLNHEAFHAYLESYVYPHNKYLVPRWLNEGLAQVFETAQLDADTLRVDAPDPELLRELQLDLRSAEPYRLAELLSEEESLFAAHRGEKITRRRYLYAWGLAYYLAFGKSQFGTHEFEAYVSRDARKASPIARFEHWIDQPLAEFEQVWRAEMLQLK